MSNLPEDQAYEPLPTGDPSDEPHSYWLLVVAVVLLMIACFLLVYVAR
jgi:hypothetical protein